MVKEAYKIKYYFSETLAKNDLLYLSIFVSSNSFQYAIFNNEFKNVVALQDVEFNEDKLPEYDAIEMIALLCNNSLLYQKKFEKVNICILNIQFTLLPESFADATDMNELLNFTNGQSKVGKSLTHKTKQCNFSYKLSNDWIDFFGKTFPNASIRHSGAVQIGLLFEHLSLVNTNLFLSIRTSLIEISVKKNNQLLFYNVFSFESKEDILYYLLSTMEQMELNPLSCKLSIASELETNDELIKIIKKYIKEVEFCVLDKSITFQKTNNQLPNHFYFTLLNQHLCEL